MGCFCVPFLIPKRTGLCTCGRQHHGWVLRTPAFHSWRLPIIEESRRPSKSSSNLAIGGLVTSNFFKVLGMRPLLGRTLVPEDQGKGAPPVAVLTNEYWVRAFGADPNIVGQTLDLTVKKAVIVGVLEPGSNYATQRKQDF